MAKEDAGAAAGVAEGGGWNLEAAQSAEIFSDLTQTDICQVVGLLKQQNHLISLLARNSSEANQEQDNGIKLN